MGNSCYQQKVVIIPIGISLSACPVKKFTKNNILKMWGAGVLSQALLSALVLTGVI